MPAPPGPARLVYPAAGTCRAVSSGSGPGAPPAAHRSLPSDPATVPRAIAPHRTPRCHGSSPRRPRAGRRCGEPVSRPPRESPPATPCRTRHESAVRVLPSLLHVKRSGVSEPSLTLLGCRQWPCPCPLPVSLPKSGPFPRPALPSVFSHTGLSATLTAQPAPHGVPVGVCAPPTGLPVLPRLPSSMHASAITPGGSGPVHLSLFFPNRRRPSPCCRRVGSRITRFGACSTFTRVLAYMFAKLLNAALVTGVLQPMSLPP